jgi:endonuclease G
VGANGHGAPVGAASPAPAAQRFVPGSGAVTVTVPVEVTVQVGAPVTGATATPVAAVVEAPDEEAVQIDPDYTNRPGYDPAFLGTGKLGVPLPALAPEIAPKASQPLPYFHFSVVMNTERRLAFFTAVNIDGTRDGDPRREPDKWSYDPRLPREQQTGEEAYANNPLDRGHLVRRIDPAWGDTAAERKKANDDTFHFTNCSPQHKDFNQNKNTWAGLEDYILRNAQTLDFKATVFSGPVFADDDDEYRHMVKLPRQFWKVAVMTKKSGDQSATGYLLSQAELIAGLEVATDFNYGAYKTFQVPVATVERLTHLDFGKLKDADPLAGQGDEAAVAGFVIAGEDDLRL